MLYVIQTDFVVHVDNIWPESEKDKDGKLNKVCIWILEDGEHALLLNIFWWSPVHLLETKVVWPYNYVVRILKN